MKLSKNIEEAKKNYPEMYHVVNSNEVHSFENREDAQSDFDDAVIAEEKIESGFEPELIED